jgi:hypothetical protein
MLVMNELSACPPRMQPRTIGAMGKRKRSNTYPTIPKVTIIHRSVMLLRAENAPMKQNITTNAEVTASGR